MSDTTYTRGIRGSVLRTRYSRGRIADQFEDVIVVGPEVPQLHPVRGDAPAVVIGESAPGYRVLRPAEPVPDGHLGYMAGGTYVVHSGCYDEWMRVFGHDLPMPLHDYVERVR